MNFEAFPVFSYNDDDFVFSFIPGIKSQFDEKIQELWKDKMLNNCFRYKLGDLKTKYLPGKYNFVSQLNVKRAVERRQPQNISSIAMPFNPNIFHFGKVSEKEVLFTLNYQKSGKEPNNELETYHDALIINVSPIEECHCLLVPSIEKCLPQVLTIDSLRLAVDTLLLSCDRYLRIGFNSLGAYASVNHLHFHIYYLRHDLPLENVLVNHLKGRCFELISFPSEGFAFQIRNKDEILDALESVMKLVDFLVKKEIPHNLFILKGKSFTEEENSSYVVRIFLWARKATYGAKNDITFNPAVCELAGHVIAKEEDGYETINEAYVSEVLYDACHTTFTNIRDEVLTLYQ